MKRMEKFEKSGFDRRREEGRREGTRSFGGERPRRRIDSRTGLPFEEERPRRSFGDRDERPRRSFDDRDERPRRNFGEGGDRPRRSFGDREERPRRSFGERDERPRRSFGEGGDRPRKSFGDREERPRRSFGSMDERPRRSFGDRPRKSFGDHKGFGDRRSGGFKSKFELSRAGEEGLDRMLTRKAEMDAAAYSDNDTINIPVKETVRLNKFIANSGVCSRREADDFIQAGVVTVNGVVVTELGSKVNVSTDDIRFNGERLHGEEKVYIVMNKPKGYVTTASDPHAEKTVMELLKGCKARVFPVGRLDRTTTGVLMFTNDGEMSEKLTHPSYDKKKIYQVTLDKDLTQEDYDKIKAGIMLNDGQIAADELEYIDDNDHRMLGIEIHSGRNRIVRRIFESLGYDVKALDRVYFAGLTKKGVQRGEWRFLTESEVNILKMGAYK